METVLHFMFVSFHDKILCLFIFCIIYSFHGLFLTSGCFAHVSASQYKTKTAFGLYYLYAQVCGNVIHLNDAGFTVHCVLLSGF